MLAWFRKSIYTAKKIIISIIYIVTLVLCCVNIYSVYVKQGGVK